MKARILILQVRKLRPGKASNLPYCCPALRSPRPLATESPRLRKASPPGPNEGAPAVSAASTTTGRTFGIRLQRQGEVARLAVSLGPQAPTAYSRVTDPKSHRGKINKEAEDPADLPQPPANYRLGSWQKGPCACGLSMQWDIIQP